MARLMKMFPVLVMILLLSSAVQGQTTSDEKETLKGIKSLRVIVGVGEPDIKKDGLQVSSIQTDVELKLRMAGIKVLTEEEWLAMKEVGGPYLFVGVDSFRREGSELYAFHISVELNQLVYLNRNPDIIVFARTWRSAGSIGTAGRNNVANLRNFVKDQVDIFINDYLAVNPKE